MSIRHCIIAATLSMASAGAGAAQELPNLTDYLGGIDDDVTAAGLLKNADGGQPWFYRREIGSLPVQFALGRDDLAEVKEKCSGNVGCDAEINAGVSVEKGRLTLTVFSVTEVSPRKDPLTN